MNKDILRFVTCGSVDDGKSTLIGRLLYEINQIPQDQYNSIVKTCQRKGKEYIDLSLVLDGLESEREQGITIDVAYRYFESKNRKYIVADCPGHLQYTRNMFTGASVSDAAVVLIDASRGITTQTKRHLYILSLLRCHNICVVINKMDLVGYSIDVYNQIIDNIVNIMSVLKLYDTEFVYIPVSAFYGENVYKLSETMDWYQGITFFEYLENVEIRKHSQYNKLMIPIQGVIRQNSHFRGYSGKIECGNISIGDNIYIEPDGLFTQIKSIIHDMKDVDSATCGENVTITFNEEIDVERGQVITNDKQTIISNSFNSIICWMSDFDSINNCSFIMKHMTNCINCEIDEVFYKIDIDTFEKVNDVIEVNDIAYVSIICDKHLCLETYENNKKFGSFILIDKITHNTVAAGVIVDINTECEKKISVDDIIYEWNKEFELNISKDILKTLIDKLS